jgi:hypothetical protein
MRGKTIFHVIHLNVKLIVVVAYISAAKQHMTRFLLCGQVNDIIRGISLCASHPLWTERVHVPS